MLIAMLMSLSAYSISAISGDTSVVPDSREIVYLEDGYYIVYEMEEPENSVFSTKTVTGKKTGYVYDSSSTKVCSLTLNAKFSVDVGVSAKCTSATYSTASYVSGWSIESVSVNRSGATATASGTAKKKVLGITTHSSPISVSMTCDKYGNVT